MPIHKLDKKVYFGQKAFIEKDGKLLVLRDPNGVVGGQKGIDIPGGKYRWGQDLQEELKREVREETALEINIGESFVVWTYFGSKRKRGSTTHTVLVGYKCTWASGTVKLSDEHDDYEWVDRNSYRKWEDDTQDFKVLEVYFNPKSGA